MASYGSVVRLVVLASYLLGHAGATERPVIGVLTQELSPSMKMHFPHKSSYINAIYVKAVEAAGARVAPIFINKPVKYYRKMISSVNGVLLPGGDKDFTAPDGYAAAGRIILELVQKLQDSGISLPILGVCQGLQLLIYLASKSTSGDQIMKRCDDINSAVPLVFRPGFINSRLYRNTSPEIIDILKNLPVTFNNHRFCITEETLQDKKLQDMWNILTTNKNKQGLEFISSMEHSQRPIVGLQFHPEQNAFAWNPMQANPHSRKAIQSARVFYDWLVTESLSNNQRFPSTEKEEAVLIYNYNPLHAKLTGSYSTQIYLF